MNVDPYPPADSGEPSANSGAAAAAKMLSHVEAEARNLRVGRDQVEERHDHDGRQHGLGDRSLRLFRLLGEVRRGLEPHEDQHAVEHPEEDAATSSTSRSSG